MKYLKLLLGAILGLTLLLSPTFALAQNEATSGPKSTFEIFWPLTAGKTMDDPLYFLKTWKENLNGILIFGNPQKAEYAVLLATKRVLEADKLLQSGKKDLADQSLIRASEQFTIAQKNINDAKKSNSSLVSVSFTIKPRLDHLTTFLPMIQSAKTEEVLQKIKNLQMEF